MVKIKKPKTIKFELTVNLLVFSFKIIFEY
uniref:Uncharacterized protein n=1 Tax=Siphoviridae sp. ctHl62 TaxID=2826235 RepID=A0A8S5MGA2_9CAUD|nr:MAG TPA: hypothetical protein [Siphoviridae sp. ctHl62]DAK19951.1 MAG TPA: hypothetical protein [Caudoviricetes sp.]DAY21546.1 MAG TPA: hypothetical protein [Caudoviricetes sp.]